MAKKDITDVMSSFENLGVEMCHGTDPEILGAAGFITNGGGHTTYTKFLGRNSLSSSEGSVNEDSVLFLASAGKFITHVAALQLVDKGALTLDSPIPSIVPELGALQVIETSDNEQGFTLRDAKRPITLRHLLLHSSGIAGDDSALIDKWKAGTTQNFAEDAHPIVKMFSTPLLFDPGHGWHYGHSVHWLQLVIANASGEKFVDYVQGNIFDALAMSKSSYMPWVRDDMQRNVLEGVKRGADGKLHHLSEDEKFQGLACNVNDIQTIFVDLISKSSRLLKPSSLDLFFEPAFASGSPALQNLRADRETYAAPIGLRDDIATPPVNYSCGVLVIEDVLPKSGLPKGTVTWNGMPNLMWALHRERHVAGDKGVAMFFGAQLLPVDDEKTVELMLEFFKLASLVID